MRFIRWCEESYLPRFVGSVWLSQKFLDYFIRGESKVEMEEFASILENDKDPVSSDSQVYNLH